MVTLEESGCPCGTQDASTSRDEKNISIGTEEKRAGYLSA